MKKTGSNPMSGNSYQKALGLFKAIPCGFRRFRHVFSLLAVLVAVLLLLTIPALPVFAIADPDSPPQVNAVDVYELSDGGLGVLIDYYIDYAVLPTELADEAYLAIFIDTDGTTQLKSAAPYVFVDSGYGRGLIWIRFSDAEVTTYSLDSANQALYRVWLQGNPTLTWAGDPPKTIGMLASWNLSTATSALGSKIRYYADELELAWLLDMVQPSATGNVLTNTGEAYFLNVIPDLKSLSPEVFMASVVYPTATSTNYASSFSAVATGAIINGSPVTLVQGTQVITATGLGTFDITINPYMSGSVTDLLGSVSGSPYQLIPGSNNITVTVAGTLTVYVHLDTPQQAAEDSVVGTGFDLTAIAALFGMPRLVFSTILWIFLTVLICGGAYVGMRRGEDGESAGSGSFVMLLFAVCLIGGGMLGLLDLRVLGSLVIFYAAFVFYILFFRNGGGDIGRTVMFMGSMWLVVVIVGGLLTGQSSVVSTSLTADITDATDTIPVTSTEGFLGNGRLLIGDEVIYYTDKSATSFYGHWYHPVVRGGDGTTAVAHSSGDSVRTPDNALLNNSVAYSIAQISDASGLMYFVTLPVAIFSLIMTIVFLPIEFLGTDMWIFFVFWCMIGVGLIISIAIAVLGGRRV